jgi:thiamine biosynthesis protein ThiI
MHFVVKYFPEITIKSAPVRKRFTRQLQRNLKTRLRAALDCECQVERGWDRLNIAINSDKASRPDTCAKVVSDILATTPGIAYFAKVSVFEFDNLEALAKEAAESWRALALKGTFCVRVKRTGNHDFSSTDVERLVGGLVLQSHPQAKVKLKDPDLTLRLEVAHQRCFVIHEQQPGLGGFPLGTVEPVLSLVSGGFDSTVASYLTMRRGMQTHFLFFNLGGPAHELGVKEVSYYLWHKYGASHSVKFVSVPFEAVVKAILQTIDRSQMGVVLKRMMLRVAEKVALDMDINAVVTGESVAQVASQTLTNLSVIDSVINTLVLRPLIAMDKGEIINLSRRIGTENFSAQMPEYCGVISVKPTTRATEPRVAKEEANFAWEVLHQAFNQRQIQSITEVNQGLTVDLSVPVVKEPSAGAVVVDIRHPTEAENTPLFLSGTIIKTIPFYHLSEQFPRLEQSHQYLLYCEQGVMSQLHAAHLKEAGFHNVGVFRP